GPTVNYDIRAVENFTTNIGGSLVIQSDSSLWVKGISCPSPEKPTLRRGSMALTETKSQEVGSRKTMESTVTLYHDGRLSVDVWTRCNNLTEGLRGRVLVIFYDEHHNAIGTSQEIRCHTRGGVLDPFTPSSGRQSFIQQFPQEIAQRAAGLEILQADETVFGGEADRILKLVGEIKAVVQGL
ncbi:hypothetical protein C8J57DRAFT_1319434, partial [Mycena rebaudengoi]